MGLERYATLRTEIDLGFGHKLKGADTGPTRPKILLDLGVLQGGEVLSVSYSLEPPVGFVVC